MGHGVAALVASAVAVLAAGAASAEEASRPLADCAAVVGAWLTTNPGKEPSRSLLSLTADGLALFG